MAQKATRSRREKAARSILAETAQKVEEEKVALDSRKQKVEEAKAYGLGQEQMALQARRRRKKWEMAWWSSS